MLIWWQKSSFNLACLESCPISSYLFAQQNRAARFFCSRSQEWGMAVCLTNLFNKQTCCFQRQLSPCRHQLVLTVEQQAQSDLKSLHFPSALWWLQSFTTDWLKCQNYRKPMILAWLPQMFNQCLGKVAQNCLEPEMTHWTAVPSLRDQSRGLHSFELTIQVGWLLFAPKVPKNDPLLLKNPWTHMAG